MASSDQYPVMDTRAFVLSYAMHLCTIGFVCSDGWPLSERLDGAVREACRAWNKSREPSWHPVRFDDVWKIVNDAWVEECSSWWPDFDMTLEEFDDAADTERMYVLRVAFNRHTGILENFIDL